MPYFAKAPLPPTSLLAAPRTWFSFVIVDPAKWSGFTPFILFNDAYTMALLFLLSGLFTWSSLKRKGPRLYYRDRLSRLGITMAFMCLLAPAAYYPAYLQSQVHDGFWHEWWSLHAWPLGPSWFLLALLVFDVLAVAVYRFAPRALETAGQFLLRVEDPFAMVLLVTVVSGSVFVPLFVRFGAFGMGPVLFPVARIAHDLTYFLIGLALGSAGPELGIVRTGGRLAARWQPLLVAAPAAFVLWQGSVYLSHRHYNPGFWAVVIGTAFAMSCAVSVFASLAVFLHGVRGPIPFWDSLLVCALGIFAIHFLPIPWIQLVLLHVAAPGWLKGAVTFILAFPLCWAITSLARRSPRLDRFL